MKVYKLTNEWPEDFRGIRSRYIEGYERPYCFYNGQYEFYIREKDIHDTKLFELVQEVEVVVIQSSCGERHFDVRIKGATATAELIQEILSKHFNS